MLNFNMHEIDINKAVTLVLSDLECVSIPRALLGIQSWCEEHHLFIAGGTELKYPVVPILAGPKYSKEGVTLQHCSVVPLATKLLSDPAAVAGSAERHIVLAVWVRISGPIGAVG
jgi:hypothetical protein